MLRQYLRTTYTHLTGNKLAALGVPPPPPFQGGTPSPSPPPKVNYSPAQGAQGGTTFVKSPMKLGGGGGGAVCTSSIGHCSGDATACFRMQIQPFHRIKNSAAQKAAAP